MYAKIEEGKKSRKLTTNTDKRNEWKNKNSVCDDDGSTTTTAMAKKDGDDDNMECLLSGFV